MSVHTLSFRWRAHRRLRAIAKWHPPFAAVCGELKAQATSLEELGLVIMDGSARPAAQKLFLGAALARSQTFFLGVLSLVKDNPLGAIVLLRAYVEVLAATAYVRKNRHQMKSMFEPTSRPGLETKIQTLVNEWTPMVRDLYRFLTDQFHFNNPHHQLQRVPGRAKDFIIARVYGDDEQLSSGVLTTLAQITEKQIQELRDLTSKML